MKNIAIVGHGYVGKAVEYGFNTKKNKITLIDPALYGNSVEDIKKCDVAFVCVPTPFGADGSIDASIVVDVTEKLLDQTTALVVIKSTVIPSIVKELSEKNGRVIYNPEFLTERNALNDFVNPPMHIFGGEEKATEMLQKLYDENSRCARCNVYHMSAQEAAFVKYAINSFLATKVMWFNQYKELVESHGADYDIIISAVGNDPRISHSHTAVPGPDGRSGYGGACFPKDTNALAAFAGSDYLSILKLVIAENNCVRSQYELDDREKEQNVVYMAANS